MNVIDTLLWGILPYVVMLTLVGGLIWRYKYDQFG
ncbi:UNVERIFIED_CONTAM: respiratory nitrate reductase subunit gamma, partial [Acinetobacter sp. HSTU-ASm16]